MKESESLIEKSKALRAKNERLRLDSETMQRLKWVLAGYRIMGKIACYFPVTQEISLGGRKRIPVLQALDEMELAIAEHLRYNACAF